MFSCFAGCLSTDNAGDVQDELVLYPPEKYQDNNTDTIESDEENDSGDDSSSLAGTCPFGRHCCGSPGCSCWTDLNNDGCCDLGVSLD
jgi:hypothetical protein